MLPNKFRISRSATNKLIALKSKTQLTPNILCRIGFCLSLSEGESPDCSQHTEDGMEFNRYTLLGDCDALYIGLLRERLRGDGLDPVKDLPAHFRGHLNRGVEIVTRRVRSLQNILELIPNFKGAGNGKEARV